MVQTDVELQANDTLALTPAEQEILSQDVPAFARTLKDPASRERYAALAEAVETGEIPGHLARSLETMLELALQTKAVRHRHGPDAERTLSDLYFRTGRGGALRQAAREVTRALEALKGQTVEKIGVTAAAGRHTITINTDRAHLTLSVDHSGVAVDRVEVGG
ncbi:MAG: hypothetical protein AB7P40_13320 [Chloroflexota bacterium]